MRESEKLDRIFTNGINRIPQKANHKWIIPLSGGHDSRIIVNYLHKAGIKNVICFSYSVTANKQARISKQVAEALRYSWYFVEYTPELLKEIYDSGHIDKYRKYAFNGVSSACMQDFAAVYYLKKQKIVKSVDIFIPGHSLDFIAGSHLQSNMDCTTIESAFNSIKRHFSEFGYIKRSQKLSSWIKSIIENYSCGPQQIGECFN